MEAYDLADYEAILYARLSQNRDGRSRSIPQQLDGGRGWCDRMRIPIAEEIVDDDLSASRYARKEREGYEQVLTRGLQPQNGKRRILVVWESSRAQRELEVYVRLRKICEATGALFCYDGRVYDMRDPDDRRRTAEDAVRDEYEVEITRKRVLRDVRASAAAGRPHGKLAYGYRIIRDDRDGHPIGREPHPEHAPIVQEIVRRLLAGETSYSVAKDLNARGIPGPRLARRGKRKGEPTRWTGPTLTRLAKNPTYAALRVHNGEVVGPGTWPALITREDHDRLVAIVDKPSRLTHQGTEPKAMIPRRASRCHVCGAGLMTFRPRGSLTYACSENFCVARSAAPVERMVTQAVLERLGKDDAREVLVRSDEEATAAFAEARELQERLDSFVDKAAEGELSSSALARIEAKLKPKIAAAERRGRAAISSPLVAELLGIGAREGWEDLTPAERWEEMTTRERREVVASLCVVTVLPTAKRGMRWNPRFVHLDWVGEEPTAPAIGDRAPLAEGGDPMYFPAPEVLSYLRGVGLDERIRVLDAERSGLARKKILQLSTDRRFARPMRARNVSRE